AFLVKDADPMIAPIGDVDVAVAVDRDIGRVVELVGSRVAGLLALAGDIGAKDRHLVGVVHRLDRAIGADAHERLALVGQLLHTVVLPIGDVDVAIAVGGDAPRLVELAGLGAGAAAFADKLAFGAEDLQPVVAAVGDNDVAVLFDREA